MIRESIRAELAADWFKQQGIVFDEVFQVRWCGQEKQRQLYQAELFEEVHPDARIQEMDFGGMKESLTR